MTEPHINSSDRRLPAITRAGMVADELGPRIHSGECSPGARRSQAELAKEFGASTTPVREASTALALEGLVRQGPHRGAVVFEFGLDDFNENYDIRIVLEPLATELAALRIKRQPVKELNAIITQMRSVKGSTGYHALNRHLHATIYAAAQRPRLLATIESLRDAAVGYVAWLSQGLPGRSADVEQVHEQHEQIVATLAERRQVGPAG